VVDAIGGLLLFHLQLNDIQGVKGQLLWSTRVGISFREPRKKSKAEKKSYGDLQTTAGDSKSWHKEIKSGQKRT